MIGRILNDVFGNVGGICWPSKNINIKRSIEDITIVSYLNLSVRKDASYIGFNGLNMENLNDGFMLGDRIVKGKPDHDEVRQCKITSDL